MCGINGYTWESTQEIQHMNTATKHRGPDSSSYWSESGITIGHNRLSIIDISSASNQPMHTVDGRYHIVYNGELYNFQELKQLLSSYPYTSTGDTEVILAAYATWGKECVKKFNGMFAFAIWDSLKEELFIARDHAGIKPLYYTIQENNLIFSSEIKGILSHKKIKRVISKEACNLYFSLLYVPQPHTMIKDIYKFPQSSYGIWKHGMLEIFPYTVDTSEKNIPFFHNHSYQKAQTELVQYMRNAVHQQLIADRPVGVYLSGGMDSSIVLHHACEVKKEIDTFSVGFFLNDPKEYQKFNADCTLAKKTASYYGTNHHEYVIDDNTAFDMLQSYVSYIDDPISKPTALAMFFLAQQANQHVTVALGGDGGDELFGGYERYRLSRIASLYQHIPSSIRACITMFKRGKELNTPPNEQRYGLFMFQKEHDISSCLQKTWYLPQEANQYIHKRFFSEDDNTEDVLSIEQKIMDIDRKTWLPDDSLLLTDTMMMAAGLEGRVPFLDTNVIAYANTLPLAYKVTPFQTKKIVKDAYKNILPPWLYNQPKRGWYAPGAKWLRSPIFSQHITHVLSPQYYEPTSHIFQWDSIRHMLVSHQEKRAYHASMLWAVYTFQLWAKQYSVTLQ